MANAVCTVYKQWSIKAVTGGVEMVESKPDTWGFCKEKCSFVWCKHT